MSESIETNPQPTTSSLNSTPRTFDVTLNDGVFAIFEEAHDATESGGVLTVVGLDGGALAIFAPGSWKSVIWRAAKCTIEQKEAA